MEGEMIIERIHLNQAYLGPRDVKKTEAEIKQTETADAVSFESEKKKGETPQQFEQQENQKKLNEPEVEPESVIAAGAVADVATRIDVVV